MPSTTMLINYLNGISYFAVRLIVITLLICITHPLVVIAHTDLTDRIDVLSHKIKHDPDALNLYVELGYLMQILYKLD